MSNRNTPIGRNKSEPQSTTTPRSLIKNGLVRNMIAKQTISTPNNLPAGKSSLNSALSSDKLQPTTPKNNSALKTKSKSSSSLNSCFTPSSLYKNTGSTISLTRTTTTTPRTTTRAADSQTPECYSKVSLDTPKRMIKKNSLPDISTIAKDENKDEISNLKVAVRVRPMNTKECTNVSATNIIKVHNNEITVSAGNTADNASGVQHKFQYDHAYWSCNTTHSDYADQAMVFEGTALPLIDKAFEGYNACLFAYGQTGSGKSYSMMGIESDEENVIGDTNSEAGIIPRFCQELFHRINRLKHKIHAEVEVSYFEIYNEKIHDLLAVSLTDGVMNSANCVNKRPTLKVREHPIWGPYIVDLSTHPVDSHMALRNWLAVGNSQRATAATGMNDKSSRSHSIFSVVLNLSEKSNSESGELQQTKRSKISLVDLAGSERVNHTCASGDRLKEGVSINKSLLTLGKVIAALADTKKSSAAFVPYRESVLTWLLRENLGGNSRTVMLATISPVNFHLDETLATLRYACQARTIVNRVKVNEDPHDRIIRELRAEVERLQALRQDYERQKRHSANAGPPRKIIIETSVDDTEVEALRQQLADTEHELNNAQRSWMERLKEAEDVRRTEMKLLKRKGLALELSADQKQPCLVNLAADPMLSGTLLYILPPGTVKIGRPSSFSQPDIILEGPLVSKNHCSIENRDNHLFLLPEASDDYETFVNGERIAARRQLYHGDRLVIGGSHYFRISNPMCPNRLNKIMVDFQLAHQEILQEQEKCLREELNAEKQMVLSQIEAEREANEREYEERLASLELERFKYKCSKELLETEKAVLHDKENSPDNFQYTPFKSTLLDDIKRILEHPTEESLHQTQLKVKEATQRCREFGLAYEFKQTQKLDEFGIFRAVVNIIDRPNMRLAEWPPSRLDVWLNIVRDNLQDLNAGNLFDAVDLAWQMEVDLNSSLFQTETANSSRRISLNINAMKDMFLGSSRRSTSNNSPLSKKELFAVKDKIEEQPETPDSAQALTKHTFRPPTDAAIRDYNIQVKQYLRDIQNRTNKLRKLCGDKNNRNMKLNDLLLTSMAEIDGIVNKVRCVLTEDELRSLSPANKTPKSVRFLID